MNLSYLKRFLEMRKYLRKRPLPHTKTAFKALVDAVIPNTHKLAEKYGDIQSHGALDLYSDEYQIWSLNHFIYFFLFSRRFNLYLANSTAELLNTAAGQLIKTKGNKEPVNIARLKQGHIFAAVAHSDRLRVIVLLQQKKINFNNLPIPFLKNPGLMLSVINSIIMLTTIGYYSEWSGYGSTRNKTPEKRKLEHFPLSWKQVGYPGPSEGYHAFRGYLIENFDEQI